MLVDMTWEPPPLLIGGAEEGGDSRGEVRAREADGECVWRVGGFVTGTGIREVLGLASG
jgi:hypothetical protein